MSTHIVAVLPLWKVGSPRIKHVIIFLKLLSLSIHVHRCHFPNLVVQLPQMRSAFHKPMSIWSTALSASMKLIFGSVSDYTLKIKTKLTTFQMNPCAFNRNCKWLDVHFPLFCSLNLASHIRWDKEILVRLLRTSMSGMGKNLWIISLGHPILQMGAL